MGVLENEPSGKRFRKGSPKKYQHPNFKKDSTQQELQSILRTTFPNGNKVVGTIVLRSGKYKSDAVSKCSYCHSDFY